MIELETATGEPKTVSNIPSSIPLKPILIARISMIDVIITSFVNMTQLTSFMFLRKPVSLNCPPTIIKERGTAIPAMSPRLVTAKDGSVTCDPLNI